MSWKSWRPAERAALLVNVALASGDVRQGLVGVSGIRISTRRPHLNDGHYGNERSWISNGAGRLGLSDVRREYKICRVDWSRDRHAHYRDRLPVDYTIEAETGPGRWVASEAPKGRVSLSRPQRSGSEIPTTGV